MKNVKILSLFIILSIPFISLGQFTYNVSTGVFNYDYNPCTDPCVMANTEDCLKKANMRKCFQDFDNQPFTDQQWLACRAKCRILDSQIRRVNKRPVGFIARVQFTTNTNNPTSFSTFDFNNGVTPLGWLQITSSDPSFTGQAPIYSAGSYYCYRYVATPVTVRSAGIIEKFLLGL
jgi:hypothetical protein